MKSLNRRQQAALKIALDNKKLNPLRQAALKSQIFDQLNQNNFEKEKVKFFLYKPLAISLSVILAVALTGGVVMATEKSLPGDILHPIKLTAEKLQLKMAISEEKKATVEAHQAEERLNEAAQIKEKIKITNIEPKIIEKEAKTKAEKVIENLENVKTNLEAKGRNKAVQDINRAIEKIEKQAERAKIRLEKKEKEREKKLEEKIEEKKLEKKEEREPERIKIKDDGEQKIEKNDL